MNVAKRCRGATQVRVPQSKEPRDFLKLFKGRLIIHKGKHSDTLPNRMYHVRGTQENDTSAVQVNLDT